MSTSTPTTPELQPGAIDEVLARIRNVNHVAIGRTPLATGWAWEVRIHTFRRNPRTNVSRTATLIGQGETVEEALTAAAESERAKMWTYEAKTSKQSSVWVDADTLRVE